MICFYFLLIDNAVSIIVFDKLVLFIIIKLLVFYLEFSIVLTLVKIHTRRSRHLHSAPLSSLLWLFNRIHAKGFANFFHNLLVLVIESIAANFLLQVPKDVISTL